MILSLEEINLAAAWQKNNRIAQFYPDTGPLRRELYPKHISYFDAGATHSERLCISANRVGKTEGIGCYEVTLHATGDYPEWWKGRRSDKPVDIWVVGKTSETTRDILQAKLVGKTERAPGSADKIGLGSGLIPADRIITTSPKAGVPGAIDTVWVRHRSGGTSSIGFKSYGKDRDSFEGTSKFAILADEEPPKDVYDECLMRLMSTVPGEPAGLMMVTFTPLEGYTEVVTSFLESDDPDRWYVQIGWVDAPHISKEEIARLSRKYLPSQLRARSEGVPSAGDGAIYPIAIEDFTVDPFPVPDRWPRAYGLDVGKTAVAWGALDPDSDVLYLYSEYYSEEYNPVVHAAAIKARGAYIPGVIDPGSLGSSQVDGRKLMDIYRGMGLDLAPADNAVEAGLQEVWMRLSTGRLKVFSTLTRFRMEYPRYHRHKVETVFGIKSVVVKKHDHMMDAVRYLHTSGLARARCFAPDRHTFRNVSVQPGRFGMSSGGSWMQ